MVTMGNAAQRTAFSEPTEWKNEGHRGKQEKRRSDENWPKVPFQGWSGVERDGRIINSGGAP